MLKNLGLITLFILTIYLFGTYSTVFYGEKCVVSLNYSSGEFYTADNYSLTDEFIGNGKCKSYSANFNYQKNVIEKYQAKIVGESESEYAKNYYLYSPTLNGGVIINGKKVNAHIAVTQDKITVGYPIIYYGY